MDELLKDDFCLTCIYANAKNEDKDGNPEYVECRLKEKEMPIDGWCESLA